MFGGVEANMYIIFIELGLSSWPIVSKKSLIRFLVTSHRNIT